jgi:hypothetical protein
MNRQQQEAVIVTNRPEDRKGCSIEAVGADVMVYDVTVYDVTVYDVTVYDVIMCAREGGSGVWGGVLSGGRGVGEAVTVVVTSLAGFGQQEDLLLDLPCILSELADEFVALLALPLVVATAELAVPALGGLEVRQLAQTLCLRSDVLLRQQYFLVDFDIQSHLHLCVGRPAAALLALAPVFLPPQQVPARDAVPFGDLLGVDALQDLRSK